MDIQSLDIKTKDVTSFWLNVSGHRVHCLKSGSGPAVLLLHGGASDGRDWLSTMAALPVHFTFYAPDIIGFGKSDRRESGYYVSDFTDFVVNLIDQLEIERPAVVGHSFGARVGLDLALQYPEKVNKLVLVDAAGLGKVTRFGTILLTGFWGLRQILRRPQPYPRFLTRDGDDPNLACLEELQALQTPTLLVWKRFDPYVPLVNARRAASLIPRARLEIVPGYGHAPHKQETRTFVRLLRGFLEQD